VVFATTLGHKLVLFPAWLCYRKGRASVHKSDLLYMKGVEVMWHKSERRDCKKRGRGLKRQKGKAEAEEGEFAAQGK